MAGNERDFTSTKVYFDGVYWSSVHCVRIEDAIGLKPSRAVLYETFGPTSPSPTPADVNGPVTLVPPVPAGGLPNQPVPFGTRVSITGVQNGVEVATLFNGWLMKRSDQGAANKVLYSALDDKILLQWIPIRGALVWDGVANKLRFSSRHPAHFNPGGFWNCTGWLWGARVFPVFTNVAHRTKAYEAPNTSYYANPDLGGYNPWTPRRILDYLYLVSLISQLSTSDPDYPTGLEQAYAPSLYQYLGWSPDTVPEMVGYDPADTDPDPYLRDPLDYKADDINLQGHTMLTAFDAVLKRAGTHSLRIEYNDPPISSSLSGMGDGQIGFVQTGYSPEAGKTLSIARSGYAGQLACDCYDFTVDEDASALTERILVEGDVIRGESRFTFTPPAAEVDYAEDTVSDIVPAWTKEEEAAFLKIIHGGDPASPSSRYAMRAIIYGDPSYLETADGSGTPARPLLFARDDAALQHAMEAFPTVFRAWKLNGKSLLVQRLLTVPEECGGPTGSSRGGIQGARPILSTQLQFFIKNLGGGTDVNNWMTVNLPVRVELRDPARAAWFPVPTDTALRVTDDGTIWLDGLGPQNSHTPFSVLNEDVMCEKAYRDGLIKIRHLRINAAVPTDYRVEGYRATTYNYLSDTIRNAFHPDTSPLMRYVDAGNSFKHHFQYESYPSLVGQYYGGTDGASLVPVIKDDPLTREVPPGSEARHAEYAAHRYLAKYGRPSRQSTFRLIGVRPDWRAGDRLQYVEMKHPDAGSDFQYVIRAPVTELLHDFLLQETVLGGITSDYYGSV